MEKTTELKDSNGLFLKGAITAKDMFNASNAEGLKEIGKSSYEGTLVGFGIKKIEKVDKDTGEVTESEVTILKMHDGKIIAGESDVVRRRVKELEGFITPEDLSSGIDIKFLEVKAGRGTAISFNIL